MASVVMVMKFIVCGYLVHDGSLEVLLGLSCGSCVVLRCFCVSSSPYYFLSSSPFPSSFSSSVYSSLSSSHSFSPFSFVDSILLHFLFYSSDSHPCPSSPCKCVLCIVKMFNYYFILNFKNALVIFCK